MSAAPREVADWVEQYRRYREASFDGLEEYLAELQGQRATVRGPAATTRRTRRPKHE